MSNKILPYHILSFWSIIATWVAVVDFLQSSCQHLLRYCIFSDQLYQLAVSCSDCAHSIEPTFGEYCSCVTTENVEKPFNWTHGKSYWCTCTPCLQQRLKIA